MFINSDTLIITIIVLFQKEYTQANTLKIQHYKYKQTTNNDT